MLHSKALQKIAFDHSAQKEKTSCITGGNHRRLEASGVLAVVTASIILGKSQHELLDAQNRLEMRAIWKSATFFMEATIFILIGMALRRVIHEAGGIDSIFSKTIPSAFLVTL